MSITKNVFRLNTVYDLVVSGQWIQYDTGAEGTLWAWGNNQVGNLGIGDRIHRSSPVQIPGTLWSEVSGGSNASLARKTDGTLWAWGINTSGQLGQSDRIHRSSPVQIPGTQWNDIAASDVHVLARKTDGTLWAWGCGNADGRLGDNNLITRSSPVQIPGTQWNDISTGTSNSYARKTDGTLWAWGPNNSGILGTNTSNAIHRSSPTQVPGTQWNDVSGAQNHALARKTDGTLWAWGLTTYGALGDGTAVPGTGKSSPIQVPGTQWNDISAGAEYSLARKTDGTLWSWGDNSNAALGDGTTIHRSSPVQIPGTTWNDISAGFSTASARKTDGTLWGWGSNFFGQLFDGTTINRSSPVQVPGTQWNDVLAANSSTLARKAYP